MENPFPIEPMRPALPQPGRAFITGSQAYGTPTNKSDVDLVILCGTDVVAFLRLIADPEEKKEVAEGYPEGGRESFRFGKLNVICCTDSIELSVWEAGTKLLMSLPAVTREFAVATFKKLRGEIKPQ